MRFRLASGVSMEIMAQAIPGLQVIPKIEFRRNTTSAQSTFLN